MKREEKGRKSRTESRTTFALCSLLLALTAPAAADEIYVTDGDTLKIVRDDGSQERIRIENIDAPEVEGAECPDERERGLLAGAVLAGLVRRGDVEIERTGTDRYRRTLARIYIVDGGGRHDVGQALIDAGLARPWTGRREDWCGG